MAKFNLAELVVKFTGDTSGLDKSIANSEKSVSDFKSSIGKISAAAAAAAGGLALLYRSQANVIDANDDMAKSLGVSYGALQQLSYIARFSGVDIGQLTSALGLMQRTIGEAAAGAQPAIDSLAKIGLRVQDIINLSPDQQFSLIAQRIGEIQNPAERTAVAMDLFGRQGRMLNDVFTDYNSKAAEAKKFTEEFGLAMSGLDVETVTAASDEWEKLGLAIEGIKTQLVVGLAPAARQAAQMLRGVAAEINQIFSKGPVQYMADDIIERSGIKPQPSFADAVFGVKHTNPLGLGKTTTGTSNFTIKQDLAAPMKVATTAAKEFVQVQDEIKRKNDEIRNSAADAFSGFVTSIGRGQTAMQAFKSVALNAIQDIINNMFRLSFGGSTTGGLGGSIASAVLGGLGSIGGGSSALSSYNSAFNIGSKMFKFADGGVVNRATMFPIGTNMGVMGEAGPEAIMPLTRKGGKLGVQASGGGGTTVVQNINISTGVNQTVREEFMRLMPQIEQTAVAGVQKAQRRGTI